MDKISLIIPVYNGEEYLRQCLDSAINQSFSNYEIIVINDGSTDQTGEICGEYKSRCDFLRIVHHTKNLGLVPSWQDGVLLSSGDYIAFLDSDDWVDEQYLEHLASGIAEGADIVCCNYNKVYTNRRILQTERIKPGFYTRDRIVQEIFPILLNDGTYLGRSVTPHRWGKLFRKKLLLDNLQYCNKQINYGEDLNIFFPAVLDCSGLMILEDKKGLYFYRQNECSMIHSYKQNMFRQITLLRDRLLHITEEKAVFDFTDQINRDFWCLFFEYVKNETRANALVPASRNVYMNYEDAVKRIPCHYLTRSAVEKLLVFCLRQHSRWLVYCWMKLYSIAKRV